MRYVYSHIEENGIDATVILNDVISEHLENGWELYGAHVAPLGSSSYYTVSFVFRRALHEDTRY